MASYCVVVGWLGTKARRPRTHVHVATNYRLGNCPAANGSGQKRCLGLLCEWPLARQSPALVVLSRRMANMLRGNVVYFEQKCGGYGWTRTTDLSIMSLVTHHLNNGFY